MIDEASSLLKRPVALLGLGAIGCSWATLFLARGLSVRGFDKAATASHAAHDAIRGRLERLGETRPLIEPVDALLRRFTLCNTVASTVSDAGWVQESVVEDQAVKAALFAEAGAAAAADAILASSTSEIPGSLFFANMPGRERGLVAHPINPPHVIPLVELCPAPFTAPETVERARAFMRAVGQSPIVLTRELSGYIANRLQMALVGEAMRLVGEGWCTAADADRAVKDGIGLRWAFLGPFETGHLNAPGGAKAYYESYREAIRKLMTSVRPDYDYDAALLERIEAELRAEHPEGVAERQAWRDRRLAELRRFLDGD